VNLSDLREAIRVKTGYPERGDTGTKRLNNIINQALRTLWGEIPEVLLKKEYRLELEPQRTCTVTLDASDPKVFKVASGSPFNNADINKKILSARWFEWQYNGTWYHRRIAEVGLSSDQNPVSIIVVTDPVPTEIASTATAMNGKIYTYEYPYDADIQSIRRIVKNPESNPREVPISVIGSELAGVKISSGWQSEGQIQYYGRGDFYQQPSPHYLPLAEKDRNRSPAYKWGFTLDSSPVENVRYGPSGTFSYKVCHVWGRYSMNMRQIDGGATDPDIGRPFYISSPSSASDKVTVVWGQQPVVIKTPDIDYVYGFGQNVDLNSYHKSGVEKWIFRARHATTPKGVGVTGEGLSGPIQELMEDDGIYYLWKVVDGETTEVHDVGQMDPVSKGYQLKDFMGHYHIRFDKRPTAEDQILVACIKRPPTLNYDTDSPNLPPECYGCIIELACSYLVGDRDGEIKRKSVYYDAHLLELQKLKRMYTFSGHERPAFGNGMSTVSYYRTGDYPVTESS